MMNDKNLGSQKNKLKEIKRTPELRFKGFSDDWEERKLGDEVRIVMGQSPNSENYTDDPNDYILVQGNADMKNGRVFPRVWTTQVTKQAEKDDLILSVRAPVGDIGKTAYDVVIGRGVAAIKGNEFIFQNLGKMKSDGYWTRYSTGSTFESINSTDIKEAIISVPTIEEQNKIGSFFKQLDNTIALHQRKLDKLKQLKQGYLQQLFPKPGETVPKIRFANFEGEWEERKLKQLGEIQTGNTPSTKDSSNYAKNGILWVTPTDIDSLIISDTAKKLSEKGQTKARIAKAGSILVTSIASIGKNALAKTDMGFNQQINSLTPSSENDSYFLLTQSEKWSEMMQRNAAAGTMQIVNKSEFSNIVTEVPKLDEQGQIGNFFAKLDQTITLQLSKINKLKSIKQALLQKMFI
ncbi:restriction endonuclease subunit S [Lactococcus petauri]|uniref:restriction endonuclease subunit S n=1 Tax=Lactococcus petauri TaxID=1940789 RepID=UPI00313348EA